MPAPQLSRSLWLIGAGRMGSALLEGWIQSGLVSREAPANVVEPMPHDSLRRLMGEGLVQLSTGPLQVASKPSLIVLAVKPQMLESALPGVRPLVGPSAGVVSIMAGKTIASIRQGLGADDVPVVRAMPNTPAAIGEGITAAFAGAGVEADLQAEAESLLRAAGEVVWLPSEDLIDQATAISGSGPAYVFHLVEVLAQAGEEIGLTRDAAEKLARATVVGSAALMKVSDETPGALRVAVTSPGGTTEAALAELMGSNGLGPALGRAVRAALARARALGKNT